jgi:hypothetical protein
VPTAAVEVVKGQAKMFVAKGRPPGSGRAPEREVRAAVEKAMARVRSFGFIDSKPRVFHVWRVHGVRSSQGEIATADA